MRVFHINILRACLKELCSRARTHDVRYICIKTETEAATSSNRLLGAFAEDPIGPTHPLLTGNWDRNKVQG
jgi:hypothetical protein